MLYSPLLAYRVVGGTLLRRNHRFPRVDVRCRRRGFQISRALFGLGRDATEPSEAADLEERLRRPELGHPDGAPCRKRPFQELTSHPEQGVFLIVQTHVV